MLAELPVSPQPHSCKYALLKRASRSAQGRGETSLGKNHSNFTQLTIRY